jgi:hypothetical protein
VEKKWLLEAISEQEVFDFFYRSIDPSIDPVLGGFPLGPGLKTAGFRLSKI